MPKGDSKSILGDGKKMKLDSLKEKTKKRKRDREKMRLMKSKKKSDKQKILEIELKLKKLSEQQRHGSVQWATKDRKSIVNWEEEIPPSSPSSNSEEEENDDRNKNASTSILEDVQKLYFYDVTGDQNNVVFKGLYKLDIPNYYRAFKRNLLIGSKEELAPLIIRDILSQKLGAGQISTSNIKFMKGNRYFSDKMVIRERDKSSRRIRLVETRNKEFSDIRKLKSYIPLEGGNETDFSTLNFEEYILEKTRDYNKRTRESPYDLELWFKFIEFQDEVLSYSRTNSLSSSAILEKKISIYEKAIEYLPKSEKLIMAYINICQKQLDPDTLNEKWNKLLHLMPSNSILWKYFLIFKQSQFSTFTVSDIRESYFDSLKSICREINKLVESQESGPTSTFNKELRAIEEVLFSMIIKTTIFTLQSGYTEKAIAGLQALIEFNCFRPPQVRRFDELIECFESFWESDNARVGDYKAETWKRWYNKQVEIDEDDAVMTTIESSESKNVSSFESENEKDDNKIVLKYSSKEKKKVGNAIKEFMDQSSCSEIQEFDKTTKSSVRGVLKKWTSEELQFEYQNWLPLRDIGNDAEGMNMDSEDHNVLERVVLMDDIQGLLIDISSIPLQQELFYVLLEVAGIPSNMLGYGPPKLLSTNSFYSRSRFQEEEEYKNFPYLYGGSKISPDSLLSFLPNLDFSSNIDSSKNKKKENEEKFFLNQSMEEEKVPNSSCNYIKKSIASNPFENILFENDFMKTIYLNNNTVNKCQGKNHILTHYTRKTILTSDRIHFCKTLLQKGVEAFPAVSDGFKCSLIAFEACTGTHKSAVKLAKRYLKNESQNLKLWNAYAQLEYSFGNVEKVFVNFDDNTTISNE